MHLCSFFKVETCQEQIITLELKDPITNAPLTEEQLAATKVTETTITTPSDDENSSIITVRSNASNNNDGSMVRLHLANDDNEMEANVQSGGISGGSFLTAAQHHQSSNVIDEHEGMQTIVEVVNPLISGQGYANTIAVGRSNDDSSYPSFDPSETINVAAEEDETDEAAAATNFDSLDAYNMASELSLSDKMKNVLKELVRNERVRLSFSQSISDGEDSDSEQNDTDDDANEPLRHDSADDESTQTISPSKQEAPVTEENGNAVIAQLNIVDENSDSGNNDDIKNANIIDDDFIYKNPNFLMAGDEMDASTSAAQQQSGNSIFVARNERDEKLKEKLLAELNVQPSGTDENRDEHLGNKNALPPTPPPMPTPTPTTHTASSTNDPGNDDDEEESSISVHEIPSLPTSTIETSSKSDSISSTGSNKRKKRKSKARKK